jgi:hypothetical protein
MSFGPSGQSSSYTPPTGGDYPAPPRRGRSPWFYVGMGCAGLVLVSFVGCAVLFSRVASELKNAPTTAAATATALKDIPAYPKANWDAKTTQVASVTLKVMSGALKATSTAGGGYTTDDLSAEVFAFYDKEMAKRGYKIASRQDSGRQVQHMYVNKTTKTMAMIQVQDTPGENGGRTILVMRFDGVDTDKVKPEQMEGGGG